MAIRHAYLGEDVPVTVQYTDPDTDAAVDPDDTSATADAVADASITIYGPDDAAIVTDAAMTRLDVGSFEYVWDSATAASGTGEYEVRIVAEFGGETKISVRTIELL